MASIRRFCISMVIIFSSAFCVLQTVLFFYNTPSNHLTNILIDFEDNMEPAKDQEHESKLKEDKLNNLNAISLNRI